MSTKECMGYGSQKEAVIAMYEAACEPKLIAKRAELPINSVHRVLSMYRRDTGRTVTPRIFETEHEESYLAYDRLWDMEDARRRLAIMTRAAAGAKRTREAAGL